MSKAQYIREMYDHGDVSLDPSSKKRAAKALGITTQTVHATLVKYIAKKNGNVPTTRPQLISIKPIDNENVSVQDRIRLEFKKCLQIATDKGIKDLQEIYIKFDLKGVVAGQYCYQFGKPWFCVNMILAIENIEEYLARTVPHEFAHYIDHCIHGSTGHGRNWKRIMVNVFGLNPKRCHNYDVSNALVRKVNRPHVYKCQCNEYPITPHVHKKISRGKVYTCRKCNTNLVFHRTV